MMKSTLAAFALASAIFLPPFNADAFECKSLFTSVDPSESGFAAAKIIENISRLDGLPGAVIAARTRENPNYYYHWIRDAGLVIEAILGRYQSVGPSVERGEIRVRVFDYLEFSKRLQSVVTISGLGEPKVYVDGTAFNEPWGRPQNDSPALRAVSLITLAKQFNQLGATRLEVMGLGLRSDAASVLKQDLDYVVRTWRDASVDIWEEVMGHHFYTRMVQRRALRDGADWAAAFGDGALAETYRLEAEAIEKSLAEFWSPELGFIRTMLPRTANDGLPMGLADKSSGMDIAVILGLLHGARGDGFMAFSSPEVQATLEKIESRFRSMYAVNRDASIPGTAIGRYPEDQFSGADRSGGNPWVLATLAMGEAYYRAASELRARNKFDPQIGVMIAKGDGFLGRVRHHRHPDGSLNEQFHRDNGFMHSVEDLTWSYAAMLTALTARETAVRP